MRDINIIIKYGFAKLSDIPPYQIETISTEKLLISEIVRMSLTVAESYQEYYNAISKKILLDSDFIEILQKACKGDLESENCYLHNLVKCAKEYYECDEYFVFQKCIPVFNQDIIEEESIIINSIAEGVSLLEIIDNKLVLPQKWFSENLYKKISEFLKTFDFDRNKLGKRVCYINNGDFSCEQVIEIGKKLDGISLSEKFDFYPTPKKIVDKVIELAEIKEDMDILEPSAGKGDLIKNISNCRIVAIEKNQVLSSILNAQKKYSTVLNLEFEDYKYAQFDRIIMNPPFSNRLDAKHICKAFKEHLKIYGIMVAIHSSGIVSATDKYSREFQELCNKYMVERIEVASGEFKESGKGTNIQTIITKLQKNKYEEFNNEQLKLF